MAGLRRELLALGIPVSGRLLPQVQVNTRAKRRLGCCFYQGGRYWIEVSDRVLGDGALLRQTLVHELLHTCPGCRDHGAEWKRYAGYVNGKLGTDIQCTVKLEGAYKPLRHEEVKYILRCQCCGKEFHRMRMCKLVRAPWRYRCPCGGKLERV